MPPERSRATDLFPGENKLPQSLDVLSALRVDAGISVQCAGNRAQWVLHRGATFAVIDGKQRLTALQLFRRFFCLHVNLRFIDGS